MMRIETRMGAICLLTMLVMVANTWLAAGETRAPAKPKESAELNTVKALQAEFLKLKFGMFIHYNMATYVGREWVDGYADPATFDPGGPVDTDAWADAAKAAGMTYAVLTTKHVGGFCLWDSKYTTYDVMHPDCPVQEDIVGKFVKSFTNRGLKVGLYYCWRHPGFPEKKKGSPYLDIVVSELRHLSNRHLNNKTFGETCWCLERKWFHSGGPTKNAANIVQQLQTANSRNANFLLNIGPDKQGRIHPDSLKVLTELGELLGENGEVNSTQ